MGLRDTVTPFSAIGWLFSAGWSHLIDGSPNYGTTARPSPNVWEQRQRSLRAGESLPDQPPWAAFHEDTLLSLGTGSQILQLRDLRKHSSRIIGKTDGGRAIPNYASLIGGAGGAALTYTYYPETNQNGGQVATTFATGIGSAVLNNLFNEFGGDIIRALNLAKE